MPSNTTLARVATIASAIILGVYLLNLFVVAGVIPISSEITLDGAQQFVLLLVMSALFTANLMLRYAPSAVKSPSSS